MRENEVEIFRDGVVLRGTLTLPLGGGARSVVLMLHGSGPLDRNENIPGQRLDVFNILAARFAAEGHASLRYDKRGCGRSGGNFYQASHADHVADAAAWIAYLKTAGVAARLFLLGHSVGTLVAAQLAQAGGIDGLILICPFIQDIETILRSQAARMQQELSCVPGFRGLLFRLGMKVFGEPVKTQDELIARLKSTTAPVLREGFLRKVDAAALREQMAIDPHAVYSSLRVPALVFAAGKDIQCDPHDAARIAAAIGAAAEVHVEPDLTHVLRKDTGPGGFLNYGRLLKRPMDPCVADRILEWLRKQPGAAEVAT